MNPTPSPCKQIAEKLLWDFFGDPEAHGPKTVYAYRLQRVQTALDAYAASVQSQLAAAKAETEQVRRELEQLRREHTVMNEQISQFWPQFNIRTKERDAAEKEADELAKALTDVLLALPDNPTPTPGTEQMGQVSFIPAERKEAWKTALTARAERLRKQGEGKA